MEKELDEKAHLAKKISLLVQNLWEDNQHRYALMTPYKSLSNLYLTKVRRRRQRGLRKHTRELSLIHI